jgi:chaperonin GroES
MLKLNIIVKKDSLEYESYLNLIKPVDKYVIIKKLEREEVTAGGIIIPTTVEDDSNFGIVISNNSGHYDDKGFYVSHDDIKIGDIITYNKWCEKEVAVSGKIVYLIEYPEINGFIKKEYFEKEDCE